MRIIIAVLLCFCQTIFAQSVGVVAEDLRDRWTVREGGAWIPFSEKTSTVRSIYFTVDAHAYRGSKLEIKGIRTFSIWINGKLLGQQEKETVTLSIDSLSILYSPLMTVAVHADRGVESVATRIIIVAPRVEETDNEVLRRSNYILDFTILAVFILSTYFITILQFNRRLTLDYFNIVRLFSLQERDDTLVTGRITSRFSFLVYIFIGMWCSFLALIIFHNSKDLRIISGDFSIQSITDGFMKWGQLTIALFVMLFAKISVVLILSGVFRLREGAAIQVLNYFRLLSFLMMLLSVILIFYFTFNTVNPTYYENLISLTGWILGGWAVLIFIKLLNKSTHSVFHLFSYLCASEFFPIIILFKVLFF